MSLTNPRVTLAGAQKIVSFNFLALSSSVWILFSDSSPLVVTKMTTNSSEIKFCLPALLSQKDMHLKKASQNPKEGNSDHQAMVACGPHALDNNPSLWISSMGPSRTA